MNIDEKDIIILKKIINEPYGIIDIITAQDSLRNIEYLVSNHLLHKQQYSFSITIFGVYILLLHSDQNAVEIKDIMDDFIEQAKTMNRIKWKQSELSIFCEGNNLYDCFLAFKFLREIGYINNFLEDAGSILPYEFEVTKNGMLHDIMNSVIITYAGKYITSNDYPAELKNQIG